MTQPKLLLISVDGLRPDAYLGPANQESWLSGMARLGGHSIGCAPVFPTVTYTNHATLATGAASRRHGILANTRFDARKIHGWHNGEPIDWHFRVEDIQAPTLWEEAKRAGKSVGLLRWPTTLGAQVDWLVPEIFAVGPEPRASTWEETVRHTDPTLIRMLSRYPGFTPPESHEQFDTWVCESAKVLLSEQAPDLLMIHLSAYDHEVHEHGLESPQAARVLHQTNEELAALISQVDLSRYCVMVFGDHGFRDFEGRFHINAWLCQQGWLKSDGSQVLDWSVIAHTNCAQAAIYSKDPLLVPEILSALEKAAMTTEGPIFEILDRAALDRQHAFPDAVCAISAAPGFSMGQNLEGPTLTREDRPHGEHGYAASDPEMRAGFVCFGAGVPPGTVWPEMGLIDIAPTAAKLLGIALAGADGCALPGLSRLL